MAFLYQSDRVVAEGYANYQQEISSSDSLAIGIRELPKNALCMVLLNVGDKYNSVSYDFIRFSGEPHLNHADPIRKTQILIYLGDSNECKMAYSLCVTRSCARFSGVGGHTKFGTI